MRFATSLRDGEMVLGVSEFIEGGDDLFKPEDRWEFTEHGEGEGGGVDSVE